jgi:hypothetical protein
MLRRRTLILLYLVVAALAASLVAAAPAPTPTAAPAPTPTATPAPTPSAAPAPAPALPQTDLLVGQWSGTWSSTTNGMKGALTCTVKQSADGTYTAAFKAIFGGLFTHKSTVALNVDASTDPWTFKGKEDLGFMAGGVYTYEGRSDGKEFTSTYDSTFDKGTFKMNRAETGKP